MVYYLAILGSVALVIMAVFSVMLTYMDSKRMRAFFSAKALKEHLDVIIQFIVKQSNEQYNMNTASMTQLQSLAGDYSGLKINRDALEMIPLVNSIVSLYKSLDISSSIPNDVVTRGGEISDSSTLEIIELMRAEYNNSVESLNRQLNKRLLASAGKLLRMKKLEELCDISNFFR